MNQVSWLIYLADVAGNMGSLLVFLGIVLIALCVAYLLVAVNTINLMERWREEDEKKAILKRFNRHRRTSIVFAFLAPVLWIAAAFVPSQSTVLAIAASQFGEQLLHTPTANLAEKALNSWLQKQITANEPAKPEK